MIDTTTPGAAGVAPGRQLFGSSVAGGTRHGVGPVSAGGQWKAADVNRLVTTVLQDHRSEARQAQLLMDAFEDFDAPR